jgi:hypothetical protein
MRLSYKVGYYLVVALFDVFPLPQQSGVRESFAYAGESVDHGYSVLVYPEGVRTPDGKPSPFRSGLGMLAARLNVPVLPLRIDGLFEMKTAGPQDRAPGSADGRHRQTHALPAGNAAGGNHEPGGTCDLDDVTPANSTDHAASFSFLSLSSEFAFAPRGISFLLYLPLDCPASGDVV